MVNNASLDLFDVLVIVSKYSNSSISNGECSRIVLPQLSVHACQRLTLVFQIKPL